MTVLRSSTQPSIVSLPEALPSTRPWRTGALTLIGVMTILRFAGAASTELTDTEGYYVSWSRFPDWSYYDHPPMVAWMTWLTTRVSHSALHARIVPVLCAGLAEALLFQLGARLFSERVAFLAVGLHVAIPAYFFTALLVNPEATLAPSWLLALLLLDDLRRHREATRPLWLGAAIGLAFLSKYTAVLLVPVTLLVVIASSGARHWLTRPSFYAGGLVALAIASPVALWNAYHGWPSLELHLVERVAPPSALEMLERSGGVAAGQLVLFHPAIVPLLLGGAAVVAVRARHDARHRFLALASLPVLAFLATAMLRVRDAEPHWTMVGFLPLLIGAAVLLDELLARAPRLATTYAAACAAATFVLIAATFVHALTGTFERTLPHVVYDGSRDAVHETLGWTELRAAIDRAGRHLGPRVVVAAAHNVFCGHLLVELDDRPEVYCPSVRRTQFDFIGRGEPPVDGPVLFIEASRDGALRAAAMRGRVCTRVDHLEIARGETEASRYEIFACEVVGSGDASLAPGRLDPAR
ncbi:MAG: glycosyltransferase family 39 protein [Deltaproteobacteria bacterium]|nr:glycosyltransferase family 39 protein [Deltaproteobacteria bacterium]